jgi:hypothetical protein
MTAFVIAVILGAVVAVAYLTLAARSFLDVRRRVLAGASDELGTDAVYDSQGGRFTWRAGLGVVASILVLAALTLGGGVWYVVPFLAIGSSVAVVAAFLVDAP